ncbi:MAG: GntR family transcriptional regulator [Glaciihabitans sp.]|nr:GntR family transcriptional regulator [Glaciihabitans sp.]MDQ1556647.1 GntR family transcriptional regulator [Actinomycetota bacterium]
MTIARSVRSAGSPRGEWPTNLESFGETARRMGLVSSSRVRRQEVVAATIDEAEELAIVPGMPVLHLERIRMLDGVPIASDWSCLPAGLVPGILEVDFSRHSLYETLAAAGVHPRRAETTIEAHASDPGVAEDLGIAVESPILSMRQLATDGEGHPVLLSRIRYAGDRYRLRTVFARASPGV